MLKVLVVDDNRDCANTLAMLVKVLGHDARAVYDAQTAATSAIEYEPHVVFLDIEMPRMSGHAVCRAIRNSGLQRAPWIVSHSASDIEKDRNQSQEAGFDAHLRKPADPTVISEILSDVATNLINVSSL